MFRICHATLRLILSPFNVLCCRNLILHPHFSVNAHYPRGDVRGGTWGMAARRFLINSSLVAHYNVFENFPKLRCGDTGTRVPTCSLIRILLFCGWEPADFSPKPGRRLFDICLLANLFEKSYINSGRGAANFCTLEEKRFLIWRGLLLLRATRVVSKRFWYLMTVA